MAEIIAVAVKEAKSLVRDVGSLVMLFVLPGMFIVIMSVALQGAFSTDDTGERFPVLFVDESGGSWAGELLEQLSTSKQLHVLSELEGQAIDRRRAEGLIKRGTYRIGIVVPAGIDDSIDLESRSTIEVLVDPTLSRAYALSVKAAVEGIAFASIISDLTAETRELAKQATAAADAVDELKTKITDLRGHTEECVDNLQKAEKTIRFLDDKLRSIKTKLQAAGITPGQMPAELRDLGASPKGGDPKERGKEAGPTKTAKAPARSPAPARERPPGGGDAGSGAEPSEDDAGPGAGDGGVDADVEADADDDGDGDADDDRANRGVTVEQIYVSAMGGPTPNSVQQQVPGWTIFALFWIVQILAVNMIRERLSGAFRRILVSPTPLWKYVVGATAPFFVVNMLQAVVMFAIGVYLLPWLGCPSLVITDVPALALVTVGVSCSALALGLLMASISRSIFFAASVSAILITIMAILGGIMVPRVIMPGYMQEMGFIVPHGWALDGYLDVLVRGDGVADVLDTFYALMVFALVFFVIALIRFRRLARVR